MHDTVWSMVDVTLNPLTPDGVPGDGLGSEFTGLGEGILVVLLQEVVGPVGQVLRLVLLGHPVVELRRVLDLRHFRLVQVLLVLHRVTSPELVGGNHSSGGHHTVGADDAAFFDDGSF